MDIVETEGNAHGNKNYLMNDNIVNLPESSPNWRPDFESDTDQQNETTMPPQNIVEMSADQALQVLNPICNIVGDLYRELRNFIRENTRPMAQVGFHYQSVVVTDARPLIDKVDCYSQFLDKHFDVIPSNPPVGILGRESIVRTQSALRSFMLQMNEFLDLSSLGSGERNSALAHCIQLEAQLGLLFIQLDASRGQIEQ